MKAVRLILLLTNLARFEHGENGLTGSVIGSIEKSETVPKLRA